MTIIEAYKTLGVSQTCTDDDVKKAFRRRSMVTHPDKGGNIEDFKRLTSAKDFIDRYRSANKTVQGTKSEYDAQSEYLLRKIKEMQKINEEIRRDLAERRIRSDIRWNAFLLRIIVSVVLFMVICLIPSNTLVGLIMNIIVLSIWGVSMMMMSKISEYYLTKK